MSRLPLNALRTFEAVASRLSFAKAAEALHVSPAAVSSQIRLLEERLNQSLFNRKSKHVTLTKAGQKLLPGVQRGMSELRQAVRRLEHDLSGGVLNISMVPTFLQKWMMPRLANFSEEHTHIDLRINADNNLVDFDESDFHASVRFGSGDWPRLISVKLLDDWILPVCSPQLLEKIGPIRSIEQLQQHNLLSVDNEVWGTWFKALGKKGNQRRWPLLNDSLSILMAAEQGQGIALSRWSLVARDIEAGRLVRPVSRVVRMNRSYYFVSPPHFFDMPKVALFREWMEESCLMFDKPRSGDVQR
jgi:LysR family glycine cleavage system transcriptional activator